MRHFIRIYIEDRKELERVVSFLHKEVERNENLAVEGRKEVDGYLLLSLGIFSL